MASAAAVVFTLVLVPVVVWADTAGSSTLRLAKAAASAGFILVALSSGGTSQGYGRLVLLALALSWIGDLALTFASARAFRAGLVAFLLGHVAYSLAFGSRGLDALATALAAVVVATIAFAVWRWLAPHVGDMAGPVTAYIVVISLMVVLALGTSAHEMDPRIAAGALLFFVSDLFVAREQFVTRGIENRIIGLPLYYTAQVLLALTAGG